MNTLYILTTAFTVSIDSFIAGFSLALNKRKNATLPATVAFVTYILCLAASLTGQLLRTFLQNYVQYIGAAILVLLGISCLLKKEEHTLQNVSFSQCVAIGLGVGLDGAAANLSLVLQNIGNPLALPLLFAATHFFTVLAGQLFAQKAKPQNADLLSAIMFFVLAAIKLFE